MIAFFVVLLVVCLAVEALSLRHALDGIEYDCRISQSMAEPEEPLELITVITNRKRRFVPFLRLVEDVPDCFTCAQELETASVTEKRGALRSSVYMMPRQRMTRRTRFCLPKRGRYLFQGAELSGGDFLGFCERGRRVDLLREVVILPPKLETDAVRALPGGLLGDVSVNRFIHEDPMLTLGFREYTGREPMKRISWTQSARAGQWMVKNLDHTMERTATVMLNLDTFAFGKYGDELIEKSFSLARSVCETLEEARIPYAFLTNARLAGGNGLTGEVGDGLGDAHLKPILEGLGRATYDKTSRVWSLIDRASRMSDAGRSHIVITPMGNDLQDAGLEKLTERTGEPPRVLVAMEVCP